MLATQPQPLYTSANCKPAYQLNWTLSCFWNTDQLDEPWLPALQTAVEPDGVRILQHHFREPHVSQFLISTKPDVAPTQLLRSVKGRLQHLVRQKQPKAFRRNYAFSSVGATKRESIDAYVASQVDHHPMADPMAMDTLRELQLYNPDIDLSLTRSTSYGLYTYNLHVVLVSKDRWRERDPTVLQAIRRRVQQVADKHGHLLARCAVLPDHLHLEIGCAPDVSPAEVALSYMNNIVYLFGMRPMLEFGFYAGTFGEYDRYACNVR